MARNDRRFFAVCALVFAASLAVAVVLFDDAFPEASIEFRYDRESSREIALSLLERLGIDVEGARAASRFDWDDTAKIFLERRLETEERQRLLEEDVAIWYWRHRWFRPLEIAEVTVHVSPSGELVAFQHIIAEEAARPPLPAGTAEVRARDFLRSVGADPRRLRYVSTATRQLPNRVDTTVIFEATDVHPAGAPYRYRVSFHGDRVAGFRRHLEVPESWIRSYAELRSKNQAASIVDSVLLLGLTIAALVVFIVRTRRGDVQIRFTVATAATGALLVVLVAVNAWPSAVAAYDTDVSWTAFVTQHALFAVVQGLIVGVLLLVVVGSGEPLYRERLPEHLAMPRLFRRNALRSRRVVRGLVLGYTLVPVFIAYQAIFYLVAERFGAWSPADVPYDDILSSALPWAAVLFMGFYPAVSEEFLSRAFAIPLLERFLRSRWGAIVLAGAIWGFGHAAYPNQPFWIRGAEVGLAGIVLGVLMFRFGLLPLLVWHYTIDAVYTAFLLFQSGNPYYVASAALASLVFVLPLLVAGALLLRRRRFEEDDDLTNAAIGTVPAPEPAPHVTPPLPDPVRPTRTKVALAVALTLAAVAAWLLRPPVPSDVVVYPVTESEAIDLARAHLDRTETPGGGRVVAVASAGFRSWGEGGRADGGSPRGYARVAAERIVEGSGVDRLLGVQRDVIEGATWVVRFFTPGRAGEIIVEIDPRDRRVVGWHRTLEEDAPGAALARDAALALARAELERQGFVPAAFELKEALPFDQPNRRDWLFHFDERRELAPGVVRRISVRVAGEEVTQFAKTAHAAERIVRAESQRTLWNTVAIVLNLAGALGALTILSYGFVAGVRAHGFRWRLGARAAAVVAPIALAAVLLRVPEAAANYDTTVAWETFLVITGAYLALLFGGLTGSAFLAGLVAATAAPGAA
ncbi:MAG: CPBP family glutamic-type intramembrane protease, partial [Thermoanaerobaculia bacterium]